MATRVGIFCSIVLLALLGAACGGSDSADSLVVATLPAPPGADPAPASPGFDAAVDTELSPCAHWEAALRSLAAGDTFAAQTTAVERWLESIHTSADSPAVGKPLVDFQAAAEALALAGWDFSAVDDVVLLGWVEGFLGNTLFGVGQPPVPRDDCAVDFDGPDAAALSVDCVLRLEPGFTWLIELDRDRSVELSETEADRLSSEVARRWVDAGASPLCVSQVLWELPVADLELHMSSLPPAEANVVAAAGEALADGFAHLGLASASRPVEADAIIP